MTVHFKLSVLLKLMLYTLIAIGTAFVAEFMGMTVEDVRGIDPLEWVIKFFSVIVLPAAITIRAFIDQSITTFTSTESSDI